MDNKKFTGRLFDIQGFSVHDGPGIRLTLFFKGCPLRCPWCHSPESLKFEPELHRIENKCIGAEKCGRCLSVCPRGAISRGGAEPQIIIDRALCDDCGECAKLCPTGALFICGIDYTVAGLMERVRREALFFKRSGGGVTISGGECLYQPEFVSEILKRCKEAGIHTAVDTSGYAQWEVIESIMPHTDIFLYDIKGVDGKLHERVIGVPNDLILENAIRIAASGGTLRIRLPVIPMFSDSAEVFDEIGNFILKLGQSVEAVQILPYHALGTMKWARMQTGKPIFEATPPPAELINARKKQLEDMGIYVIVG